jgi:hypothetical protein
MRPISTAYARGLALLAFVAVVLNPGAYADDATRPLDPPQARINPPIGVSSQARIHPPGGVTSQSRILPPGGEPTQAARINPPGGEPAPAARIKPPTGEPSLFELLLEWLRAQARIHPPIG